jgi:hypothetical protein
LEDHTRSVQQTLDIIGELYSTGSDVISGAELNQLQADGRGLKARFDFVSSNSSKLLKLMTSSYDELKKFSHEMNSFKKWIDVAYQVKFLF